MNTPRRPRIRRIVTTGLHRPHYRLTFAAQRGAFRNVYRRLGRKVDAPRIRPRVK